ncbi:hypothetical protein HDV00_004337, partial [Rhizophlyctis rosea]
MSALEGNAVVEGKLIGNVELATPTTSVTQPTATTNTHTEPQFHPHSTGQQPIADNGNAQVNTATPDRGNANVDGGNVDGGNGISGKIGVNGGGNEAGEIVNQTASPPPPSSSSTVPVSIPVSEQPPTLNTQP